MADSESEFRQPTQQDFDDLAQWGQDRNFGTHQLMGMVIACALTVNPREAVAQRLEWYVLMVRKLDRENAGPALFENQPSE